MSSETYKNEDSLAVHKEEHSKRLLTAGEDLNKHLETHNNSNKFNEDNSEHSGSVHVQTNEFLNLENYQYDGGKLTQSEETFYH